MHSLDDAIPWIQLGIVLWNCGLTAVLWLRKPGEDAADAVDALRGELHSGLRAQASDITEIRAHMAHMPTNDELLQLEGTVKQINERTQSLAANMKTVREALTRIEDYLLRERRA